MDGVTLYMIAVFSVLLAFVATVAFLAHRQRLEDEAAEATDVSAE